MNKQTFQNQLVFNLLNKAVPTLMPELGAHTHVDAKSARLVTTRDYYFINGTELVDSRDKRVAGNLSLRKLTPEAFAFAIAKLQLQARSLLPQEDPHGEAL